MKQSIVILASLFLIACGSAQNSVSGTKSNVSPNQDAVLWQQTSAEYDALCLQAYNIAIARLKRMYYMDDYKSGQIVIMDLDETVLDNSPYNAWMVKNNKPYSVGSWNEWVIKMKAKAVPGAVKFIEFAKQHKFEVFFISNRSAEFTEQTLENMVQLGIEVDQTNLLLKEHTSSKVDRREKVKGMGKVVMLIGDNLADFHDALDTEFSSIEERNMILQKFSETFGDRFIILPNPMYGNWQKVLPKNPLESLESAN